ncbi:MAG: DUF488 domain-containing protein [Coriobacteriia bacterium]|nr:DUF488 domain-containing protein [Coriobacteriia bacterium]
MSAVCTLGYEGRGLDEWVETLVDASVQVVVDVRDVPISRRRGFSKTALSQRLAVDGIEYRHVRSLGNPRELRHALKDGSLAFRDFAPQFRELLNHRHDELLELADLAASSRICLVCFEEDPATCHRSIVAESVVGASDAALTVEHLRHARCS